MPERAGEARPVTRANVPKDSEASSFLKFSMRAIASACECDQLIFREQRQTSTGLAQQCGEKDEYIIKSRNSVSVCGVRVSFNNVQSRQRLSSPLKAADSSMGGKSRSVYQRGNLKSPRTTHV